MFLKNWYINYVNSGFNHGPQETIHSPIPQLETDGPYDDARHVKYIPVAMALFSFIIIAFFVVNVYMTNGMLAHYLEFNPKEHRNEVWRFVSYMYVHVDIDHIAANVIYQILFSIPLEMIHGYWRVLVVYILAVLAGSMGSSIVDPNVQLVGASAGTYAMITVHIAMVIINWKDMDNKIWKYCHLVLPLLLIVSESCGFLYIKYYLKDNQRISHIAHLCGGLTGLLIGLALFKLKPGSVVYQVIQILGIGSYVLFICFGIVWNFVL